MKQGNIVTGDDVQTEFIINLNALPALLWMLESQKKNIRKEACWTISNITAGIYLHTYIPKLIRTMYVYVACLYWSV